MNKALIVIDVQKYFLTVETKPIAKRIQKFLKENADQYSAVYFTVFKNDPDSPLWKISGWTDCTNSPDTDVCDEIKEFTNDKNIFHKNILSAYKVAGIKTDIKAQSITEVYLCGFDTESCVLATAYDFFDNGIKPIILDKLTGSTSKEKLHKPAIQILERNIGFIK